MIEAVVYVMMPLLIAAGTALLCYSIMSARMEVAVSKEREALAEVRAVLESSKLTMEEKVRATEESSKRRAMDSFLADIRVEERHYVKESKNMLGNKKSMVLQERLYFRNIPLSNWVEHELVVEEGTTNSLGNLAKAASIFSSSKLGSAGSSSGLQLLEENVVGS
jgi:hypothetical protein